MEKLIKKIESRVGDEVFSVRVYKFRNFFFSGDDF